MMSQIAVTFTIHIVGTSICHPPVKALGHPISHVSYLAAMCIYVAGHDGHHSYQPEKGMQLGNTKS